VIVKGCQDDVRIVRKEEAKKRKEEEKSCVSIKKGGQKDATVFVCMCM